MRARYALALWATIGALMPTPARAQAPVTLTGLVLDSDARPIADVLVFTDDGPPAALTDSLGVFTLPGVEPEARILRYRKDGYAPRSFGLPPAPDRVSQDVATVVLQPGPPPSATLLGTVIERLGGQPVAGATVELNDRTLGVTDSLGAFDIAGAPVRWGPNQLIVRYLSFGETIATDEFWVTNPGARLDFSVALDVAPLGLPEIAVPVRSVVLETSGFYERREAGSGVFLTREDIVAKDPRRTEDLFRGMGLTTNPLNRAASTFGLADDGEPCTPLFYLDALRMDRVTMRDLNQILDPGDIEGIEVYESVGSLPARFSPVGASCGVILIWTR